MEGIPIVVPVRFAGRGMMMQTTSGWLSVEAIFVRCPAAPPKGAVIALRVALPGEHAPEELEGVVGERVAPGESEPGFWARFHLLPAASHRRIARFVEGRNAAVEALSRRAFARVPLRRQVRVRWHSSADFVAHSENISRGGMFLATPTPPALHEMLELEFNLPDRAGVVRTKAEVVQRLPSSTPGCRAGAGLQFVGADDAFRERLDRCVDNLLAAPLRTG